MKSLIIVLILVSFNSRVLSNDIDVSEIIDSSSFFLEADQVKQPKNVALVSKSPVNAKGLSWGFLQERKVSIAYFGDFITHPGLMIGTQSELRKTHRHQMYYTLNTGVYTHRKNHNAFILSSEIANRISTKKGLFGELLIGGGYIHTWPQGDVYTREDDGGVKTSIGWGYPHLMISSSLGIGWESPNENSRAYFLRIVAFGEYPYNGIMLPHLGLHTGVVFKLKGGDK
ncbi:MAG: hypothetical protein HQ506_02635 [Candidatus Marinimicrobia bacterium]|nr:hypothetical protein [Candidatus Neomarinimicrobiota bacterium]